MKSEKELKINPESEKEKESIQKFFGNKKRIVVLFSAVVIFVIMIIIIVIKTVISEKEEIDYNKEDISKNVEEAETSAYVSEKNNLKQYDDLSNVEYDNLKKQYNESLERYKKIYGEITNVLNFLKEKNIVVNNYLNEDVSEIIKKDSTELSREDLKNSLIELESLTESLTKLNNDITLDGYNQVIREFNNDIEKYKSLVLKMSKLNGFDTSLFEFKEINYKEIIGNTFWRDTSEYTEIMNNILEEKENLIKSFSNIYSTVLNVIIEDYNTVAKRYCEMVKYVSVDFIKKFEEKEIEIKSSLDLLKNYTNIDNEDESIYLSKLSVDEFISVLEELLENVQDIVNKYNIIIQIKQPTKEWVIEKLKSLSTIDEIQAVDFNNDPNGLLGKEGGYNSCIYFSLKEIENNDMKGSVIEKGTDAGGCIEVYKYLQDAKNRCEYLSQFDDTLLYSGSYTLIGTMVIRTSYLLTNEQQVNLVNSIIERFTEISN